MARTPRKPKQATNQLLEAIRFVGSILKDQGSINETHLLLSNGYAVAFNGILASGISIPSQIYAAPNYSLFEAALSKCGEEFAVSLDEMGNKLKISSGKFKAIVPCVDPMLINVTHIDEKNYSINDAFKIALAATGALASENGSQIWQASILLNGQSLISTENGVLLFEYWHGCELPTNIALPKALVVPLSKTAKKLVGFGRGEVSVTFYFDDGSWIRSQLYKEEWPIDNVNAILNTNRNLLDIPTDLWSGLGAIASHSSDGLVYFNNNLLCSSAADGYGATYEVRGLPAGPVFNIKQLEFVKQYAKKIDFFAHGSNGQMTYFVGDACRGVVAGRLK